MVNTVRKHANPNCLYFEFYAKNRAKKEIVQRETDNRIDSEQPGPPKSKYLFVVRDQYDVPVMFIKGTYRLGSEYSIEDPTESAIGFIRQQKLRSVYEIFDMGQHKIGTITHGRRNPADLRHYRIEASDGSLLPMVARPSGLTELQAYVTSSDGSEVLATFEQKPSSFMEMALRTTIISIMNHIYNKLLFISIPIIKQEIYTPAGW